MPWAASIDVDLRHAARELAAAEEYVMKKHWRFAMSSLLTATAPLEHLYTLRRHLTAEQRRDVSAMVARVETMWRQSLREANAEDAELQRMRRV
jgi:hypothetical protein